MRISALGAGLFVLTLGISAAAAKKTEAESDEPTGSDESGESAKPADSDEGTGSDEAKPAKKAKQKKVAIAEQPEEPGEGDKSYGHGGQFGLRAGIVGGYRMIFRYDQSPFCTVPDLSKTDGAKGQQKFCGHGAPMAVDLAASFTLLGPVEPFLWGRFGFVGEGRTDTQPLILAGVGVRLYTMSDSAFKIFIEPAMALEFDKGMNSQRFLVYAPGFKGDYKTDLIFHLAIGPQYDLARGVGIFLHGGLTVGVMRYIQATLELVGGVQVRFP
jgi:hypothetical protein